MILHVMHSSGATRCCTALSVGGVVGAVGPMGEDMGSTWGSDWTESRSGKGGGTDFLCSASRH